MIPLFGKYRKTAVLFGFLILVYLAQTLFAPIDKTTLHRYHIDSGQVRVLGLTVVIPYIIIWLIALMGYLRLKSYADTIKASKDGEAFAMIARGIWWFVIWLPLQSVVGGLFSEYYQSHASATADLVRIDNYFNVLILLPGFWLVKEGSQKLLHTIKKPVNTTPDFLILAFIAIAALYVLLVLHDPVRARVTSGVTVASYYEPDWLIIVSLVIPRLLGWFWGFQAVNNILLYQAEVKGKLYKRALSSLAKGLAGILTMTILLRGLQSFTVSLSRWNLGVLLAVIYLLLIIIAVGYAFIAVGAKNLQKLEEL